MEHVAAEAVVSEAKDGDPVLDGDVERLLSVSGSAAFFRSSEGRAHARVVIDGRQEIIGLQSAAFRDWLVGEYLNAHRKLPSLRSVGRVLQVLEANSRFAAAAPTVHVRVGFDPAEGEDVYYLDLADSAGRAVRICASGWSLVERPSVHFRRPHGMLALPVPSRDGSIELLRPFVNVADSEFHLLIGWMGAALRSAGPYPILVTHGEQGAAKSTLTKVIRQLIDPQSAPLLAEPRSTRDLMVTAVNGWLLAYDNVSVLPGWLSDGLCRLASGGGFAARALFSDDERRVIHAQRPIVLNGIVEFVRKGDLADRAVFFYLPPIEQELRREETEFWREFRELQPQILGGLLDAVVGALRALPSVRLARLPRMADFARFGEALGRGLGWPAETFLSAYQENRVQATAATLDDSALGTVLLKCAARLRVGASQTETAAEWLKHFIASRQHNGIRAPDWPKTPAMLANELRRLAPMLRERGLRVDFSRTRYQRLITLTVDRKLSDID